MKTKKYLLAGVLIGILLSVAVAACAARVSAQDEVSDLIVQKIAVSESRHAHVILYTWHDPQAGRSVSVTCIETWSAGDAMSCDWGYERR